MRGCLWKLPTPSGDDYHLIWIPINQTPRLPSLNELSERSLEILWKSLQHKRVRVRCLTPIEQRFFEVGWGFDGPSDDHDVRYRLTKMIDFKEWTDLEIRDCNMALNDQDLRVELIPDSDWKHRCLRNSIYSKLSCTTGKVKLHKWEESELEALDKAIERGWLVLEPISSNSRDAEIRDDKSEKEGKAQKPSVAEGASPSEKTKSMKVEVPNNKQSNSHGYTIERLLREHGSRGLPDSEDASWVQLLEKHGKSNADYIQWLEMNRESWKFNPESPMPKRTGSPPISSHTQTPPPLSSSSSIEPKSQPLASNHNNLVNVLETTVAPTIPQIRDEFNDLQSNILNQFYGKLLEWHIMEVNESLNERHASEMAVINDKLATVDAQLTQVMGEKSVLVANKSKLEDQLDKFKADLEITREDAQNRICFLRYELTEVYEESKRVKKDNSALGEKAAGLQKELNERNSKLDEMILANSNLSRQIEKLNTEKKQAEASAVKWNEEFKTVKSELNAKCEELSQLVMETTKRQRELEEGNRALEDDILKLRVVNKAEVAIARTSGERIGREQILQDLKEFEAMLRAHFDQIQSVRDTEYKRGLKDGQSTGTNEKKLQSLAAAAIMELKESPAKLIPSDRFVTQDLHQQSTQSCADHKLTVSEGLAHSSISSTPAPTIPGEFNVNYEIGLLTPSPGPEIIPSKLSLFNHSFLKDTFGNRSNGFWNNMQLTLEIGTNNIKGSHANWPRILKIHDDRKPHPQCYQRPSIGKHGALLLINDLDDKCIPDLEYPTFLNTVKRHAGVFKDYLFRYERGRKFFQERTGDRQSKDTVHRSRVRTAFADGSMYTSWTVLQYVGFDLKGYEALLTQYSQSEPFCWRNRGIPLQNVDGGFEHTLLNDILNRASTKRVRGVGDPSESERKRLKILDPRPSKPPEINTRDKSRRKGISILRSREMSKDNFTIVMDNSRRY
ncbi:hypothetical protein SBOR_0880 [Sclerotinia borealis F-4128]|uniref:Uncharacterized protein n=1 Tax=Sclerotinia borealis (strain F-4128) TaxID=1432307 RepID=W9CP85_SCLBF|nr:hypothetical protein SBOR_0880 [Sclerotinia borealis F-4128]